MKTFFPENKVKLSKFLLDAYAGKLSYAQFNKLLRKKDIKIDGKRTSADVTLSGGEKVDVFYDGNADVKFYEILSEDDNIIIVDKFKGVTSERLYELLQNKYEKVYFCHRLDRNTDGLIVFAKNEKSYEEIVKGFKERTFDKIYIAEVYGHFDVKQAVLTAYLVKDEVTSTVKVSDCKLSGSKKIATEYKVVKESENTSVVMVRLLTGRTHQIRAHLAHVGHFVLGDGKYGAEKINRLFKAGDMRLTSAKITFNFSADEYLYYLNGKSFVKKGLENLPFFK